MTLGPFSIQRTRGAVPVGEKTLFHWTYQLVVHVSRRFSIQVLVVRFDKP